MIPLGETARYVREDVLGMTQQQLAAELEVSSVHVSNIENDKAMPSPRLLAKIREKWQVDLYILAWIRHGDVNWLPVKLRKHARDLQRDFEAEAAKMTQRHKG